MKRWMKVGLSWGLFMFFLMTFVWPLIDGKEITIKSILIGFVLWIVGGVIFGRTMKSRLEKDI